MFNGCTTRVQKLLGLIMFECRLTLKPQLVQETEIYISVNYEKFYLQLIDVLGSTLKNITL